MSRFSAGSAAILVVCFGLGLSSLALALDMGRTLYDPVRFARTEVLKEVREGGRSVARPIQDPELKAVELRTFLLLCATCGVLMTLAGCRITWLLATGASNPGAVHAAVESATLPAPPTLDLPGPREEDGAASPFRATAAGEARIRSTIDRDGQHALGCVGLVLVATVALAVAQGGLFPIYGLAAGVVGACILGLAALAPKRLRVRAVERSLRPSLAVSPIARPGESIDVEYSLRPRRSITVEAVELRLVAVRVNTWVRNGQPPSRTTLFAEARREEVGRVLAKEERFALAARFTIPEDAPTSVSEFTMPMIWLIAASVAFDGRAIHWSTRDFEVVDVAVARWSTR